jgi:hypothetical protein
VSVEIVDAVVLDAAPSLLLPPWRRDANENR